MKNYFGTLQLKGGVAKTVKVTLDGSGAGRNGSSAKEKGASFSAPITYVTDSDGFVTLLIQSLAEFIGYFDAAGVGHFNAESAQLTLYPAA